MSDQIEKAIQLRKANKPHDALEVLRELLKNTPTDPHANYQAAWTCDYMGNESDAVPFYEAAIKNGLSGDDLRGALLGLGSTYRCLGKYEKSLAVFDRGVTEFPSDRSLKVFRSLTLYNLGRHRESIEELLVQLVDTTDNTDIKNYEKALRFYVSKLDETW